MFDFVPIKNKISDNLISPGVSGFIWVTPKQISDYYPLKDLIDWKSRATCMPQIYQNFAEKFYNFEVFEDDIWIVTYPKCGTTWTQEMIWLIANNFDFETAKSIDLSDRSPFFEFNGVADGLPFDSLKLIKNLKRPRIIKTHLPSILLPNQIWSKKPKIVYVSRNPKDVVVSFYHHFKHLVGYKGSQEEFTEAFLANQISFCPFPAHVMDFWKMRVEPNVLFLTYEKMIQDLKFVIHQCCEFLGKEYTKEQIDDMADHLSFDQMKKNPKCNNESLVKYSLETLKYCDKEKINYKNESNKEKFEFMRKGQVGSFKSELSEDYIEKIDQWTKKLMTLDVFNL